MSDPMQCLRCELRYARLPADGRCHACGAAVRPSGADLMQQARELLAVEVEQDGFHRAAAWIRDKNKATTNFEDEALRAIAAALRAAPEGFVLVPVAPTPERMAAAALAVLAPANGDMELARRAAQIVIQSADAPHGITVDMIAASIATMAPAYRAMVGARPQEASDAR